MTLYSWLILACWAVFVIYWFVSGMRTKRSVRGAARHVVARAAIAAGVFLLVRSRAINIGPSTHSTIHNPTIRLLGVVLCAAGIAFAIWARRHLGKHWGMPMTVREKPELVMSGPYARLRHPIYTGILIALTGNALALSLWWLAAVVAGLVYFGYAARKEEATMMSAFPQTYPGYQDRTKMIVPGIF